MCSPVLALCAALTIGATALGQSASEDWSRFPSSKPPPQPPSDQSSFPSQPAPPAPATTAPPPSSSAKETATADASAKEGVVSTRERVIPGSEPHSPSTLGLSRQDPRNFRYTLATGGSLGVLHVSSADLGRKGLLRLTATGEYFGSSNFPVRAASDTRSSGTFAVSYVLFDDLELYLSYTASANDNSISSPRLISSLGDVSLGGKFARKWTRGLYWGAEARITSFSSVGTQDVRSYAFGFAPKGILTYDVRERNPAIPLRAHANLGALLDSTRNLSQVRSLNAAEQYALSINRFQRIAFALAGEVPLPAVTPFLEYSISFPIGAGGVRGPDGAVRSVSSVLPQVVSLGAKVTAIKDLTFTAALDLGILRAVALGIPATPPWNLLVGVAFNVDLLQRSETKIVERTTKEKPSPEQPKTGKVGGLVRDSATQKPLPGVIVAMDGAGMPPVATDAESGRFLTHELPAGTVKLMAHKDGYRDAAQEVTLEAGKTASVDLSLEPTVKKTAFAIRVTSRNQPVAATVALRGPQEQEVPTSEGAPEPLRVETAPGKYAVSVVSPNHLAQAREVQIADGAEMPLAFDLKPKPERALVRVKDKRIDLLQQVRFAPGKATILAASFPMLEQLVDAIVKGGIKRLRIEGHTDNRGNRKANLRLSEDRAQAVADFLQKAGIDRDRLETVGYGDTHPVAPNLTARGREQNRRIELIVLEK